MENTILSKEQCNQIEENRRRALARRQQCQARQTHLAQASKSAAVSMLSVVNRANVTIPSSVQVRPSNPSSTTKRFSSNKSPEQLFPLSNSGIKSSKDSVLSSGACDSKDSKNVAKIPKEQIKETIAKKQFYGSAGQTIRGHCVLISIYRFEVVVVFSPLLVEIFKTIHSRLYDSKSRLWQFHVTDHDTLMRAVSSLKPNVEIEPLPKAILQVFNYREHQEKDSIPQADLSKVDSVLVNTLMPFQREGVNFGVHQRGRVLIADDMGLGKTLQAICLACIYRDKWPLLIVTPSSVRFDWAQQFKRWVPSIDPSQVQVAVSGQHVPTSCLVSIISYDLLSRKSKQLAEANFKIIIMDESHFLKNSKTMRAKAALPLLQKANHVILLSGTPALSRPSELFTQIVAVCPRLFNFHDFGVRYCSAKQHQWGWDYSGCSNTRELQLLLEEKIMIRHLKQDVLAQLPAKRRQMIVLDPEAVTSSRSFHQTSCAMEKNISSAEKRRVLMQYFHETCKVKMSAVRDYVADMLAGEKKFIIFAHHQEMLDCLEDLISKEGIEYIRIDGRTTAEQRNLFCRKFQNSDECRAAILSIVAANAGLNLSAASIVIFAELFWNPGILAQAEDRAHRMGQKDSVIVYYLVAQKTADDYIWPLVQSKLQVLGKVGLAREDFAQADTAHMQDSKQLGLLDMFNKSFMEKTTDVVLQNGEDGAQDPVTTDQDKQDTCSPKKRMKTAVTKKQTGLEDYLQATGNRSTYSSTLQCKVLESDLLVTSPQDPHNSEAYADASSELKQSTATDEYFFALSADINWDDDFS